MSRGVRPRGAAGGGKLSTRQFRQELSDLVAATAQDHGLHLATAADRGRAFQCWVAELILASEPTFDTEIADAVLAAKDLGADVVAEDSANRLLLICQCKYHRGHDDVSEDEVNDFFHRHDHYLDRAWVAAHGSADAVAALADYRERLEAGWKVEYRFITTARASPRVRELAERCDAAYRAKDAPVRCELYDFGALKDYYLRSRSIAQSIPERVDLDLPVGQWFEKAEPYRTLVAVIKGNTLRDLYRQHKQALYAVNIRGYLGNRGINKEIAQTAAGQPERFFYFNNGVSAICTGFQITGNHLVASHFQVINGAQTLSSLAAGEPQTSIDVLFRLTQTSSVSTETGLNHDIVQYNNTQNAIKLSDFRANDPLQLFLRQNLGAERAHGPLPAFHYIPKRSVGRKGPGIGIRLEDLAKLRYAYLYDPVPVHTAPKTLWTLAEDEGRYERAFGVDGHLLDVWSQEVLRETSYAIALYLRITEEAKALGVRNKDLKFLYRARFHALALAGVYARHEGITEDRLASLLESKDAFEASFGSFWPLARQLLITRVQDTLDNGGSLFGFVCSTERWNQLRRTFELSIDASS